MVASLGGVIFSGSGRFTFPLGVGIGDLAWCLILLVLLRRLGRALSDRTLYRLLRAIGVGLLGLAAVFAIKLATA